jgi:hypothetical protein
LNPANVRVKVASRPHSGRFISRHYPRMSAFDPDNVRKAVSEFTPRHQQKFENLLAAMAAGHSTTRIKNELSWRF